MFNTDLTFEACLDKVIKNPSTFTSGGEKCNYDKNPIYIVSENVLIKNCLYSHTDSLR